MGHCGVVIVVVPCQLNNKEVIIIFFAIMIPLLFLHDSFSKGCFEIFHDLS